MTYRVKTGADKNYQYVTLTWYVAVLTLTRIIKSVVTGQALVTLESGVEDYPREILYDLVYI